MANTQAVAGASSSIPPQVSQHSRVEPTQVIPPNTVISVNGAQTETTHKGATTHNMGASDPAMQASLGVTHFVTLNGVTEDIEWETASQIRFPNQQLEVGSKIDIETPSP